MRRPTEFVAATPSVENPTYHVYEVVFHTIWGDGADEEDVTLTIVENDGETAVARAREYLTRHGYASTFLTLVSCNRGGIVDIVGHPLSP